VHRDPEKRPEPFAPAEFHPFVPRVRLPKRSGTTAGNVDARQLGRLFGLK
jgi:hypothetical protein